MLRQSVFSLDGSQLHLECCPHRPGLRVWGEPLQTTVATSFVLPPSAMAPPLASPALSSPLLSSRLDPPCPAQQGPWGTEATFPGLRWFLMGSAGHQAA